MADTEPTETERFDAALEEGVTMVEQGDTPLVAAGWAAERYELSHRQTELEERVQEEAEDGDD
jgi:hypothetical protein